MGIKEKNEEVEILEEKEERETVAKENEKEKRFEAVKRKSCGRRE